jgi:GT2 family glycosyltransferase
MRISLILATVDRTSELGRFLLALDAQPYRDVELIVVDQNSDDRLIPILGPYCRRLSIRHVRSDRGLSRARNTGFSHVTGDIVGFPDDDCWYRENTLSHVARLFSNTRLGGVTGRLVDAQGRDRGNARFDKEAGTVTLSNLWQRVNSSALFLRTSVTQAIGGFDETLGLGAGTAWEGAEDIDYPARALKAGFELYYTPDLSVVSLDRHPGDRQSRLTRTYAYGAGIGRVWRKHRFPWQVIAYYLARPVIGTVANFAAGRRPEAREHWHAFRGRLAGWRSSVEAVR